MPSTAPLSASAPAHQRRFDVAIRGAGVVGQAMALLLARERLRVALAIVPDEEGATATLRATDEYDEELAVVPVPPTFKLTVTSAEAWVASGFEKPRR